MSDSPNPPPPPPGPPRVLPVRYPLPPPPPPPPSSGGGVGRLFFVLVLLASLGLNLFLCGGGLLLGNWAGRDEDRIVVREHFHSGTSGASDKVAVVRIEGAIMEGLLGFAHRQIEKAASD